VACDGVCEFCVIVGVFMWWCLLDDDVWVIVCAVVLLKLAELCSDRDIHLTLGYLLDLHKVRSDWFHG